MGPDWGLPYSLPERPENRFSHREGSFPGFLRLGESVLLGANLSLHGGTDAPRYAPYPVMVTQFVLRTDKQDKAGRCPVYLIVYFDGARLKCATGEKCKPSDWNADRQQFRRSYPLAEEANQLLARRAADVLSWWRGVRAAGEVPTVAGLRAALRPVAVAVPVAELVSVGVAYEQYRAAMLARGYAKETLRQHVVVRNWLTDFEAHAGAVLDPTTYDLAHHDELLSYLRHVRGLAPNTLYTAIKALKSFLRFLRDERDVAVGVELRKLVAKPADSPKLYLSAGDLEKLAVAMLPAKLVPTRDVFLFCCYTGLRYSDVVALHRGNVREWQGGRVLQLVQSKTRAGVSIYLTAQSAAIIDRYADGEYFRQLVTRRQHGPPSLRESAQERLRSHLLPTHPNQVMNKYLKRVAQLAGLTLPVDLVSTQGGALQRSAVPQWELVTMHTARHTFATQSLLRGMPVEILQKVLGHKKIQTTLIYAKIIEDFQHQTMRRIWDGSAESTTGPVAGGICSVEPGAA